MAKEVIPMSVKATAAAYALDETARASINVTALCRDEGVSRAVFYKYVARVRIEVFFEAQLREAGVRPITSRPFHPQTAGKVERFQQTLKKWLRKRRRLHANIDELQADLDEFCRIYNTERPHQGIGRQVPIERWKASPVAGPADTALAHPDWSSKTLQVVVHANGCVTADNFRIHVGAEHEAQTALVIIDRKRANVFIDGQLIRHLELDRTRVYQPSGRRRGGPRRPRLRS